MHEETNLPTVSIIEAMESQLERLNKLAKSESLKTLDEKSAQEEGRKLNSKRFHDFKSMEMLRLSKIPKRHEFAVVGLSGEWFETKDALISKLGSGFTVALVGGRGNGKTQIGVELIRHLSRDYKQSRYCTAFEFFMEVKAGYNDQGGTEKEVIRSFQNPILLVIDEISKRSESEWENRLLYELINRRYNDMKDTLIISNQDGATLEEALGDSIVSRMRETGGIIECVWDSFRK